MKQKLSKLLMLLVGMLTFVNSYAMGFGHVKEIYDRVTRANGMLYKPVLVVVYDGKVNADAGGGVIRIHSGMLMFARNDSEMAMVLGHELAHGTLGHHSSTIPNEYAADALGAQYMSRAGYNICTGAKLLKRFGDKPSETHPIGSARYSKLGC